MKYTLSIRIRTLLTILALASAGACAAEPERGEPASAATDPQIVGDQDALTDQFARVFNWANQVEIAASVSEFTDRETVEHPIYMLRNSFDDVRRMASMLTTHPLPAPGAEAAAAERLARMNMFLDEVDQHIRAAEGLLKTEPIDGVELETEADAIKIAIDMAAVEHAGLLDFVADPDLTFADFGRLRPHHQIAINYTGMLHETDAMLRLSVPDWAPRWDRGSEIILRSLASARTALRDLRPDAEALADPRHTELSTQDRLIGERMFALRTELAKPVPDRALASGELESAREAISTAQSVYRSLVETDEAIPYPEYEFGEDW
jgi:hypothetical protein